MVDLFDDVKDLPVIAGEKILWSNSDNYAIYETIKAEGLQELAGKGGLLTGCDMHKLTPYWSNARAILEVGAGYGRVIDYLFKHNFSGTITAIERCDALFSYLKKQYSDHENLHLLQADIRYWRETSNRFDLILMLWSGIADFPPHEQLLVFFKLAKLLEYGGKLIIDTIPANTIPLDMKQSGKQAVYEQEIKGAHVYTYSMSLEEIDRYAQLAGFTKVKHIVYYTETGRKRLLHVLS